MSRPLAQAAIDEVRALHTFFADWFRTGSVDSDFSELERVLAPDFRMVTPDGLAVDRSAVIEAVRRAKGTRPSDFAIVILAPRLVYESHDVVLLEFIEQQYRDGGTSRRLSTALFSSQESAPRGVVWHHIHETWMPDD